MTKPVKWFVTTPILFLHVDKAEIDLDPSVDPYDDQVYAKAADTLKRMRADGIYIQDEKPCLYIYRGNDARPCSDRNCRLYIH